MRYIIKFELSLIELKKLKIYLLTPTDLGMFDVIVEKL